MLETQQEGQREKAGKYSTFLIKLSLSRIKKTKEEAENEAFFERPERLWFLFQVVPRSLATLFVLAVPGLWVLSSVEPIAKTMESLFCGEPAWVYRNILGGKIFYINN